ncbi:MAG: ribosome rescue GTPase HflX [Gammaproteobacteria bacterium]|nr:ribosome rescue GTPase HflX [Gammaproteobacteria bacterium]
MLDRPQTGERALLLQLSVGRAATADETQEFRALAVSAGADIVDEMAVRVARPNPRYFAGVGKADEIAARAKTAGAELILVSHALAPNQERNIERLAEVRVLDRNGLILDIFAQRAASHEGKLQVELAQLEHLSTRLVRGWSHLERQKGGIGLRGPGETQLETDRRLIGQRIKRLKQKLDRVRQQRETGRRERQRANVPTVALVGYTNAGKTTLFNRLSGATLEAKNQLFATLDPTIRRLRLNPGEEVLLVDTVGFVRDLPHELVAAFHSTLTETRDATLLLHVIDASDPHHEDRLQQVEEVLDEIGARDVPTLRVYNKSDQVAGFGELDGADCTKISVSARTGAGMERLLHGIRRQVVGAPVTGQLRLDPHQSRIRAKLFDWDAVKSEQVDAAGRWTLEVELSARRWRELREMEGITRDAISHKA